MKVFRGGVLLVATLIAIVGGVASAQIFGGEEKAAFQQGTGGTAGGQSGSINAKQMQFGEPGGWMKEAPAPGMCSTRYYSWKEAGCLKEKSVSLFDQPSSGDRYATRFTNVCDYAVRFRHDELDANRLNGGKRTLYSYVSADFYPGDTKTLLLPNDNDIDKDKEGVAKCNALPRPKQDTVGPGNWVGTACAFRGFKEVCDEWRFSFGANGSFSKAPLNGRQPADKGTWSQNGQSVTVNMGSDIRIHLTVQNGVLTGYQSGYMIAQANWKLRRE